jgi:ADP-ribosylglycohydrolase
MALAAAEDPFEVALAEVEPHELRVDAVRAAWADDGTRVAALAVGALFGTCWAALAVGLCALHLPGYEAGVTWAISLGRDTDTNAAVAGALLGCRCSGLDIPRRWRDALWERERVERLAAQLSARSERHRAGSA